MEPMPRSIALVLAGIFVAGVVAAVVAHILTPEPPTHAELADQARRLSDEAGLDRAETERLLAGCAGIVEGHGRMWSGIATVRYEACLREAHLLD
jgi:hypothetical protein